MTALPLQIIDNFLLQYNVGQALLAAFILSVVGALPLKSAKIIGINVVAFGAIFVLTPASLAPVEYTFLGVGLLVLGPMILFSSK
ncbi:hypothetical protein [Haloarchaeobius sp. HME9146]|uniref:hypothetical protein n=1 Tax=Haloarchaeobius sp. HME9146 TaxID=2978732 RepID=UPI0021C04417|nr:hypothetical protein [Haloarchaeobius sp. HME9146]MCT9097825.1 hypothetical protein [Haloarchaeobius sp. HME9146]